MAKACKETKKISSAKKLKTIVKVTAKNVKTLKSIKNMVGVKKELKDQKDQDQKTKKVSTGKKKLVNRVSHAKDAKDAKYSLKGKEKSHGKESYEKHVDRLTSSSKPSPKAETSKEKKGTPKKGTQKKEVTAPSKAVTRRGSREDEPTEVPKPTSSKVTSSKVTPSKVTPSKVTPSKVTPSKVTPSKVTPSKVTPSKVTPSKVVHSESDGKRNKETGSNSPKEEQSKAFEPMKPKDSEQTKAVKRVTFSVQVGSARKGPMRRVEPKKKSIAVEKRRVASLNATCKVKMMYEEKEDGKKELKKEKKKETKTETKDVKRGEKVRSKREESKKKCPLRKGIKRRNQDDVDTSLILDCRSSKRVASLNASAILACTLLPEPPVPKPVPRPREKPQLVQVGETVDEETHKTHPDPLSPLEKKQDPLSSLGKKQDPLSPLVKKRDQKNGQQKKIQKTPAPKTVSPKTVSPGSSSKKNASSQSQSVALVEGVNPSVPSLKPSTSHGSPSPKVTGVTGTRPSPKVTGVTGTKPSPQVTGVTTTKLEVTKVQINSSTSSRKEKTDHQVKTILGRKDFVSKYQIETNSSQSYCVRVHNSSVETHHQPLVDPSTLGSVSSLGSTVLNVPPPAHMDRTVMDRTVMTTQSLTSSFPPFVSHIQGQTRPHMMHIGSVGGFSSFPSLPVLNIPHFALPSVPGSSHGHLRSTPFGIIPSPLDLSHGNYHHHPSTVTAASGFTLLGHSPMYQPAGPMVQSSDSSCLVHKPIPFHPPPTQLPPHLSPSLLPHASSSASSLPFQRLQQQPTQLTQSLPSVPAHLLQPPNSGLFHHHQRLPSHIQPSHQSTLSPIFVSNVQQGSNLGFPFNHSLPLSTQPSLPTIQASNDGGFAPRNLPPWFPDGSEPRTGSVPSYPPSKGSSGTTKSTYQHFPSRSPHVATVRPQVCKKQKEPSVRGKKNGTKEEASVRGKKNGTKELVLRQPAPTPISAPILTPIPQPPQRREVAPPTKAAPQPALASPKTPKRRFPHGWSWFGKRFTKRVFVHGEGIRVKEKPCFSAIKHVEGEIIRVGDSVLLRSGPKKTDLPFVARITALWESSDGEMMMSLLWYYRPEHTEVGRTSRQMNEELFASKHRDVNSVACVDDKCHVLTLNQFNRFKRFQHMVKFSVSKSLSDGIVPKTPSQVISKSRIPPSGTSPDMVFCCRKVYEFRLKRTLKNPA